MSKKFFIKFTAVIAAVVLVFSVAAPAQAFTLELPAILKQALQALRLQKSYAQEALPPGNYTTPPPPPGDTYIPPPVNNPPPPTTPPPGGEYPPPPTYNPPPPPPTCTAPLSGCAMGTWNQSSCMCEGGTYVPPSTCTPPPMGCGVGTVWNQGGCMCSPTSAACNPPMSGCGANSYWDTGMCMCKSSNMSCTPPAGGCVGTGNYWDQGACMCKSSNMGCMAPMAGCGMNSYWDQMSCMCKATSPSDCSGGMIRCYGSGSPGGWCQMAPCPPSTPMPTTCSSGQVMCAPSGGGSSYCQMPPCPTTPTASTCTNGQIWCTGMSGSGGWCQMAPCPPSGPSSCSSGQNWCSNSSGGGWCQSGTCPAMTPMCNMPSTGCGMNYYWDTGSCTCKPSTSNVCASTPPMCTYPAYSVCENNAWRCKSTSQCTAPSAGCGMGMMWEQTSCACKPSITNNICTSVAPMCAYPSYSVCENGAWRCKEGSQQQCTQPREGCGAYSNWDQMSCSCKPTNTTCMGLNCPGQKPQGMTCKDNMGNPALACGDGTCSCYNQQPQDEKSKCAMGGGNWCGSYCSWGGGKCEEIKKYEMPNQEQNKNMMNERDAQRYLKDAQRGAKSMMSSINRFEKMKGGITPEILAKVATVKDSLNKIINAKSAEELQNLDIDMGELSSIVMELEQSRMEAENNARRLADVKRNIKDVERGIKNFESQMKRIKIKSCIPADVTDKIAALKQSIATIKNATTWAEVEAAGLEDMGSLFMDLDDNRQVLEVCSRWTEMQKNINKVLSDATRQLKNSKKISDSLAKKGIDISSLYLSVETNVNKMKAARDEAMAKMTNGDTEGAMSVLEDDFYGQMDDVMQDSGVIQMVSSFGQFNSEYKKTVAQANSQIKKLKRNKVDVTELNDLLTEIKNQGNEILALMKAGIVDNAEEIVSQINDWQDIRQEFNDRAAELLGTVVSIMPWQTGKQMFNKVEMPTFLNSYMRPQETQPAMPVPGPGMVSESNPQPSPSPAMTNPVGESNPQPSPMPY